MTDIIDQLSGLAGDETFTALRARRVEARDNAQASFEALLEPADPGTFTYAERYAVAAFTAGIYQAALSTQFYADLLADESDELVSAVNDAIDHGISAGPYIDGPFVLFDESALGTRLAAAFDFAHLLAFHPKDASPAAIGRLDSAGWSATDIVSLSQLISFLAFQLRVVHGLSVLAGRTPSIPAATQASGTNNPGWTPGPNTLTPDVVGPPSFVNHSLGWVPWVKPLAKAELTDRHKEALVQEWRQDSEYFTLLVRDPDALEARTKTDLDIFYNTDEGLGRAERELAATVVSRWNGCEFCASVHQARSVEEGGSREHIDALLFDGIEADLGSDQWNAIRDAALALTATPFAFTSTHIESLRTVGLDDLSIIDLIYSSSFFNWANRLMLTLGEAELPERFRD